MRLEELRALVELEELGGDLDGILTEHERNWLAFFGWLQVHQPPDDPVVLDPRRAEDLFDGIMERIREL